MPQLWNEIEIQTWRDTPCIEGRLASEDDVREGRAVFYLDGASEDDAKPHDLPLPHCALFGEEDGRVLPVIVIQVEEYPPGQVLVGYRPIAGGNGVCTLEALQLLDGPDARFASVQAVDPE